MKIHKYFFIADIFVTLSDIPGLRSVRVTIIEENRFNNANGFNHNIRSSTSRRSDRTHTPFTD